MHRRLSATLFIIPSSAVRSFVASSRARSYASSTITRRSTTKNTRRGAVIVCLRDSRGAWAANANTAMSRHAVFPAAVGNAIASGQNECVRLFESASALCLSSTLFANSRCQLNGVLPQSVSKNAQSPESPTQSQPSGSLIAEGDKAHSRGTGPHRPAPGRTPLLRTRSRHGSGCSARRRSCATVAETPWREARPRPGKPDAATPLAGVGKPMCSHATFTLSAARSHLSLPSKCRFSTIGVTLAHSRDCRVQVSAAKFFGGRSRVSNSMAHSNHRPPNSRCSRGNPVLDSWMNPSRSRPA